MEYRHPELDASFTLPDRPTVIQVLTYDSRRVEMDGKPGFIILWECAKTVITDWQAAALPDMRASLDTVAEADAPAVARIVEWAGIIVSTWRRALDATPKN